MKNALSLRCQGIPFKTALLLFMAMLCLCICQAQQKKLDSLLKAFNTHTAEDSTRLDILNNLAQVYSSTDPEKGVQVADKAIHLATLLNDKKRLASGYNYKATNLSSLGEDSAALSFYKKALAVHMEAGNKLGMGSVMFNSGIIYFNMGNYDEAFNLYKQALKIFEQLNDRNRVAAVYNSLGINYMYLSDYPAAMENYLGALRVFEELGNREKVAMVLQNLGLVNRHLSNPEKSLDYYKRALAIFKETDDRKGMADALGNMGTIYDEMDNQPEALKYYDEALTLSESIGNKKGIASNLANLAIVYNAQANYPQAYQYLQKAAIMYREMGDIQNLAVVLDEMGTLYRQCTAADLKTMGIPATQRYAKALENHHKALELFKETGSLTSQMLALENLSLTYEKQGSYTQALEAYKQANSLRDSIHNDEKNKQIARRELEFEYEKKQAVASAEHEKKQALAAAEIKQQKTVRNAGIGSAVLLLICAIAGYVLYKRKRDAVEQQKEADFKVQVADTEMKALRSQMNPHFIFNSLNSISDYMLKNDIKAADAYLTKFAKVMRMILENSEQKEISLADDLKALELYMQLESQRLNKKFTYEIIVDEEIDQDSTLIPPLILQPFVENSIWHGLSQKNGDGKIIIHIQKDGDMLNCVVEDNGIGRQKSPAVAEAGNGKKSLGMKITNARIDIINKIKKSSAAVHLSDLTEGMRIEVKLPLEVSY